MIILKPTTKKGFTLAEILITIGIIGVVAALTIPSLVKSYQNAAYLTALKKTYSVISSGMKKYMSDNGCSDLACTNLFDGRSTYGTWQTNMKSEIPKIFNIAKDYGTSNSAFATTPIISYLGSNAGTPSNIYYDMYNYVVQLNDGSVLIFSDTDAGNCTGGGSCTFVLVDTNGLKGPNIWGRDLFYFELYNDGTVWAEHSNQCPGTGYWGDDSRMCGTSGSSTIASNVNGQGCAARIQEESWQMNY